MTEETPIRFVFRHLKGHRGALALAVFWRSAFALLPMQVPVLTGALIDGLHGRKASLYGWALPSQPRDVLAVVIALLMLVAIFTGMSAYLRLSSAALVSRQFVNTIRKALIRKWEVASLSWHGRMGSGELLNRTLLDPSSIRGFMRGVFIDAMTLAIRILFPLVLLFALNPILAIIPMTVLPLQWLLTRRLQHKLHDLSHRTKHNRSVLTCLIKENLDGMETVQSTGAESVLENRICTQADKLELEELLSQRYSGLITGSVWTLTAACYGVSLWYGGLRVLDGSLTAGDLVVFTGLVTFLYMPFRRLSRFAGTYRKGLAGVARIQEVLESDSAIPQVPGAPRLRIGRGEIEFRNISLSYAGEDILKNIGLTIEGGTLTAVAGRSGSGKSSLLRLAVRLYEPVGGQVLIDGQDISQVALKSLREQVAVVPQQAFLFSGTVSENLRLGNPYASDRELREACERAGALRFVETMPLGFETPLGEGGAMVSGGEAQRLAIARALLRKPRILLLDEATAALDHRTESELLETLLDLRSSLTIVMVAHRQQPLALADRVIVLDQGEVIDADVPRARRKDGLLSAFAEC